ncbi:hypothetical protein CHUAL_006594 [Chamberlinius hualienensis]
MKNFLAIALISLIISDHILDVRTAFLGLFDSTKNYTLCSQLPKKPFFLPLLLPIGPATYHFSLNPIYNCTKEFFSKQSNNLLDTTVSGAIMRGNTYVLTNNLKLDGTDLMLTNCGTGITTKWHFYSWGITLKGIIYACIFSCSSDGVALTELKCGSTSGEPTSEELAVVSEVKNVPTANSYKIFDSYSHCPKSNCP